MSNFPQSFEKWFCWLNVSIRNDWRDPWRCVTIYRELRKTTDSNYIISFHYGDVIMSTMASQITGVSIVYPTVCSETDERKHQSSVSLAFVREIHRWPTNSPHKGPVTRKMFPFDDAIMSFNSHQITEQPGVDQDTVNLFYGLSYDQIGHAFN